MRVWAGANLLTMVTRWLRKRSVMCVMCIVRIILVIVLLFDGQARASENWYGSDWLVCFLGFIVVVVVVGTISGLNLGVDCFPIYV